MALAISDRVGSLSLGLNGQCTEHWPSEPTPNDCRPSETGGHFRLLQRPCQNNLLMLKCDTC